MNRDAKTLHTYKPGLEEGFGQTLRKVLLIKIKFCIVSIVLISGKYIINKYIEPLKSCQLCADGGVIFQNWLYQRRKIMFDQSM